MFTLTVYHVGMFAEFVTDSLFRDAGIRFSLETGYEAGR